jgi:ATP:ADP antiporter, AAA family
MAENAADLDENLAQNADNKITSKTPSNSTLNKFLDFIWPIKNHELPKFLMITLLMFCILGIQNLIRAMKDSVIITMIGAETISFLKFWGVMPAAFLITILYVKLVSVMRAEKIFYLIMSVFLAFFGVFAFYLYPNHEAFHLSTVKSQELVQAFPNLKWFILLLSNWSFSLFYIIAELWPNAIFGLLFWQFVNKITSIDESKRFYMLFGLFGQTGLIISGTFLKNIKHIDHYIMEKYNLTINTDILSIQIVIGISLILGLIAIFAFWFINKHILDQATTDSLKFKVKKNQMTLKESFIMIANSRYIRLIAILLICYGVAINLVEGPWKSMALSAYPNPTDYAAFVGSYLSYTGIVTIIMVVIGSNIVRRLGWFAAAIITPIVLLITGLMFFLVANFDFAASLSMTLFALNDSVMIAIMFGAMQNVLSKSSKYTLFDSTKEMSYVPLEDDLKTKGKAAADMIGTKLGKSLSAFIQSTIFIIIPSATFSTISMYLMVVFCIISVIWIWGVIELNKEYKFVCANHDK